MIRVKIGESERELDHADARWVTEQVRGYERANGALPCVRVSVQEDGAQLSLASANCSASGGGGGGRAPNLAEAEVFDWWSRLRQDASDWTQGNLQAFVQRLRHLF